LATVVLTGFILNGLIQPFELFVASAPTTFADMRRALEKSSAADLSMAAHTLKGSCSNFISAP
jgi:HPt (histidine-containing phosphotransfer) domain-containing protein